jgi:hypothetical protein
MSFDLRFPLGIMFSIFGLILTGSGLFGGPALVQKSLGVNINLWWGLVMLLFALAMLLLAWRAKPK